MTDQWVPPAPTTPPPIIPPPLPPANSWTDVETCSTTNNPSFVDGIVITGVPATIRSAFWQVVLDDGASPANYLINHLDGAGNVLATPMEISGVDASITFNDPVTALSLAITTGNLSVPDVSQLVLPGGPIGSYLGSASPTGQLAWFNLPTPPIATDAPSNGNFYGRVNGAWSSGGIFTQPVYFAAANSVAIVGAAGTQRAILGGTGTAPTPVAFRWQMMLGDSTAESGSNSGSNFVLNAISDAGALLSTPLAITRSTGAITVGVSSGVTPLTLNGASSTWRSIAGSTNASLRWQMYLGDFSGEIGTNSGSDFRVSSYSDAGGALTSPLVIARATGRATFSALPSFPGGTLNYVLATNGAGVLAWAPPGIADAPSDGEFYGRTNGQWVVGGGGSGGLPDAPDDGTMYARLNASWQHITSADIADWATQLANYYPTSNPAGYQTAAQVSTALGAYLPLTAGPSTPLTGVLFSSNYIMLNGPGAARVIAGASAANVPRWALYPGDSTPETGANSGSNFTLTSYADAGGIIGNPLAINRATGVMTLSALPSFPGGVAGQVLSTNGAGLLSWATASGGGPSGPPVTISDTPPSATAAGALWWDSVGGQLYVWYQDANSSQWVIANSGGGGSSYTLPPASTTVLGGVKVDGTTIHAAGDGTISAVLAPMGDNRLINGDMRIDQRNNGAAGTAVGYTIDRWQLNASLATKGTWQRATTAGARGFQYALMFTSNSAYASLNADYFAFCQNIEADMIADFGWGTVNAQPVTLSFWASSSIAGMFGGSIVNNGGSRSYPFTFSLPANTWTFVTITIPGDTAGTWGLFGNLIGLILNFDFGTGAAYRGPANAWASSNYVGATGSASVVAVSGATFSLTGVKLEVGSVATPFNRQSLAKSMADCQRYYQGGSSFNYSGYALAGNAISISQQLLVVMRATPTITITPVTTQNVTNPTVSANSPTSYYIGGAATGSAPFIYYGNINASAEL